MKRFLAVLALGLFCSSLALADVSHATLVPVRAHHHQVRHHHAHKATKHHTPKRNRHA